MLSVLTVVPFTESQFSLFFNVVRLYVSQLSFTKSLEKSCVSNSFSRNVMFCAYK